METPLYFLNYWKFSKFYIERNDTIQEEIDKRVITKSKEEQSLYKENIIYKNNQISLF